MGNKEKSKVEKAKERRKELNVINNVIDRKVKPAPKVRRQDKKRKKKNRPQSSDIRRAPRAARSKDARRWRDWRESDGVTSEVITYKASEKKEND